MSGFRSGGGAVLSSGPSSSIVIPSERLTEKWLMDRPMALLGHICHGRQSVFLFSGPDCNYICPGCQSPLPEHLEFVARSVLEQK